jgi:hypothetical protein
MTTGLHDVITLAECLSAYGPTDDGLVEYQRRRYRFVRAREAFTHSLYGVLRGEGAGALTLRESVFRYWRRSERARAVSMGVLSGDHAGVTTFVAEYVRVLLTSGGLACREALVDREARAALDRVSSVVSTAGEGIRVALEKALSTLALERTSALPPLPIVFSRAPAADAPAYLASAESRLRGTDLPLETSQPDDLARTAQRTQTAFRRMTG